MSAPGAVLAIISTASTHFWICVSHRFSYFFSM